MAAAAAARRKATTAPRFVPKRGHVLKRVFASLFAWLPRRSKLLFRRNRAPRGRRGNCVPAGGQGRSQDLFNRKVEIMRGAMAPASPLLASSLPAAATSNRSPTSPPAPTPRTRAVTTPPLLITLPQTTTPLTDESVSPVNSVI